MLAKKLDQFYTKYDVANDCVNMLLPTLEKLDYKKITFIEPSAGNGSFIKAIVNNKQKCKGKISKTIVSCDSDKKSAASLITNYLDTNVKELAIETKNRNNIVVVGNPPFGNRSKLAIDFVNKSLEFSDTIAFIVPFQFQKWSVQNRLDKYLKLVFNKILPSDSFVCGNKEYNIRTCFQIWTTRDNLRDLRIKNKPETAHPDFVMYLHNNTKETLKYFKKNIFNWKFAVPRQGYYDYSWRIYNENDLRRNIQWMFFKSPNDGILEKIDAIDFDKLSHNNTTIPGYGKADVVQEYVRLYE
jgi:predicted RNA methylase